MTPLKVSTPNDTTIEIVRSFDAPKSLVWRAHTDPKLLPRWMTGPDGHTMPECEIDLKVGGKYRYVWAWADGQMSASGVFREIEPEAKLLCTEAYDFDTSNETLVEQHFAEQAGRTIVTMQLHYPTKAARDEVLASPMAEGLEASYSKLDAFIPEAA